MAWSADSSEQPVEEASKDFLDVVECFLHSKAPVQKVLVESTIRPKWDRCIQRDTRGGLAGVLEPYPGHGQLPEWRTGVLVRTGAAHDEMDDFVRHTSWTSRWLRFERAGQVDRRFTDVIEENRGFAVIAGIQDADGKDLRHFVLEARKSW